MSAAAVRIGGRRAAAPWDPGLLAATLTLLALGLVMVGSASVGIADRELGAPLYYFKRQALHLVLAVAAAGLVLQVPLAYWRRAGFAALVLAAALLVLVLVPGIGKEVNGSQRWLSLGPLNLQVSEPARLLVLIYLAGYLVRRDEEVHTRATGLLKPMAVVGVLCALLLAEPDFGAAVVLVVTVLGMMFLAGVGLGRFAVLMAGVAGSLATVALASPYRLERLTSFLNPWADPFDQGFQLTQSLIAIGRGEWLGVGLGASIQKLFYLPEAHTDFLFAVLAEELGLLGAALVIGLYLYLVWRTFVIAGRAERAGERFGAFLAYGVGMWVGLQAFINIGVNMGVLPTKGLTLPLMSYGGSSLLVTCAAVALVLRVGGETRHREPVGARRPTAAGRAR